MKYETVLVLILEATSAASAAQSRAVLPETGLLLAQSWNFDQRKTWGKIRSSDEAVWYLHNCMWGGKLDGDGDGAPCENLCGSNN